jgi:hypothetical protein
VPSRVGRFVSRPERDAVFISELELVVAFLDFTGNEGVAAVDLDTRAGYFNGIAFGDDEFLVREIVRWAETDVRDALIGLQF